MNEEERRQIIRIVLNIVNEVITILILANFDKVLISPNINDNEHSWKVKRVACGQIYFRPRKVVHSSFDL